MAVKRQNTKRGAKATLDAFVPSQDLASAVVMMRGDLRNTRREIVRAVISAPAWTVPGLVALWTKVSEAFGEIGSNAMIATALITAAARLSSAIAPWNRHSKLRDIYIVLLEYDSELKPLRASDPTWIGFCNLCVPNASENDRKGK